MQLTAKAQIMNISNLFAFVINKNQVTNFHKHARLTLENYQE